MEKTRGGDVLDATRARNPSFSHGHMVDNVSRSNVAGNASLYGLKMNFPIFGVYRKSWNTWSLYRQVRELIMIFVFIDVPMLSVSEAKHALRNQISSLIQVCSNS